MNDEILGICIVIGMAVLAAIMVEAHRSRLRRKAPYTRNTRSEYSMGKKFDNAQEGPVLAAPAEHSRNDRDRTWDVALTKAIAQLIAVSLKPWVLVIPNVATADGAQEVRRRNGTWQDQMRMLGTDISAAKEMVAAVSTGNQSMGTTAHYVDFGRIAIFCDTDEEMAAIQKALIEATQRILKAYIVRRLGEITSHAAGDSSAVVQLPVHSWVAVNGSAVMCYRSAEEAEEFLEAINSAYAAIIAPQRQALADKVVALARRGVDDHSPVKMNAFHDN